MGLLAILEASTLPGPSNYPRKLFIAQNYGATSDFKGSLRAQRKKNMLMNEST